MEIIQLSVKNQSVETSGITNDYKEAIFEYIWNGFEANAQNINVDYKLNAAFGIEELVIKDDGDGIIYDDISETFGAFMASWKNLMSLKIKAKLNKGKGRFSFVAFAEGAEWYTVYKSEKGNMEYSIEISNDNKEEVKISPPVKTEKKQTGTEVRFKDISVLTADNMSFDALEQAFLKEFAWFLYLYKSRGISISINGRKIEYDDYIQTEYSKNVLVTIDEYRFDVNLIVWNEIIKEKFCCYYFDSSNVCKDRDTTSFNRNTIGFSHSVYVKSDFFDNWEVLSTDLEDEQINFLVSEENKKVHKGLKQRIQEIISKQISAYLSEKAESAVEDMIKNRKTFPEFSEDSYDQLRLKDLKRVTKEIYKLEPQIFYKLKPIQEKSLLGFLNLLLSSEEREHVLDIIGQVVKLSSEQRKNFSRMLKKTSLENVIDTIKYIEGRYSVIERLKTLVYELTQFTNERDHIQKIVERHFWLFGEQYNLVSSDQRMQKVLEQYTHILYGKRDNEAKLVPDKENNRRMDIFLCSMRTTQNSVETVIDENIIVELKSPKTKLDKIVLRQIEDYMDYVMKQPEFNSELRKWKFISVCIEVDDHVKSQRKAFEDKGKPGLVKQIDNFELYAHTWDDVFTSFEQRHRPIIEKLQFDRKKLAEELLEGVDNIEGREKADTITKALVSM